MLKSNILHHKLTSIFLAPALQKALIHSTRLTLFNKFRLEQEAVQEEDVGKIGTPLRKEGLLKISRIKLCLLINRYSGCKTIIFWQQKFNVLTIGTS